MLSVCLMKVIMLWLTSILRRLKQKSVHVLRNRHAEFLTDYFRKEHTFWSESCFVCSIGEDDPDTIRKYIENQGQWHSSH